MNLCQHSQSFVKPKIHSLIRLTFKSVCPYQAFKLCAMEVCEDKYNTISGLKELSPLEAYEI